MTQRHFTQVDRRILTDVLIVHDGHDHPAFGVFRKKARILALQMEDNFTVETDRGVMQGSANDWLVTNHPDDDPGSDIWAISAERMAGTYEPVPLTDGIDEAADAFNEAWDAAHGAG